jgi:hypothetical protein
MSPAPMTQRVVVRQHARNIAVRVEIATSAVGQKARD